MLKHTPSMKDEPRLVSHFIQKTNSEYWLKTTPAYNDSRKLQGEGKVKFWFINRMRTFQENISSLYFARNYSTSIDRLSKKEFILMFQKMIPRLLIEFASSKKWFNARPKVVHYHKLDKNSKNSNPCQFYRRGKIILIFGMGINP